MIKPFLDAIASFNKEVDEITYSINHVFLTQYSMRKRLKVFGNQGLAAIQKEMKQFHNLDVITPIDVKTMTKQKKNKKQDEDEEPSKEEELLFLQQQDEHWEYCGWYKKKHSAVFKDYVQTKNVGVT